VSKFTSSSPSGLFRSRVAVSSILVSKFASRNPLSQFPSRLAISFIPFENVYLITLALTSNNISTHD